MKNLYWLRNDLRLDDNLTLNAALDDCHELLCVYVFEDRWFKKGIHGGKRMDNQRAYFLWQCAVELREHVQNQGGNLLIVKGKAEHIIPALMEQGSFDQLYYSKQVASEEREIESSIYDKGFAHEGYWNHCLIDLNHLPFEVGQTPSVFSAFRKKIEKYHEFKNPIPAPDWIPGYTQKLDTTEVHRFEDLGFSVPNKDDRSVLPFRGGTVPAMRRLEHYFWSTQSLSKYKETRNELIGANYSSKFSPWLAAGCISPRRIYNEVLRYEIEVEKNDSTYWLIFELLWRDFFQLVALQHGSGLFKEFGWKGEARTWRRNKDLFLKWCKGQTGDPFVDANMHELNSTGFMSNRGRQNVASFLTHQYKIDWRWGASYFEEKLIDYDPASNWGNWSYLSGTGNDPRKDRVFNTKLQAERYDPHGEYVKLWSTP